MEDDERFGAMAEACLKAHEAVADVGTPAMLAMTRALLWQVGQELAQREEKRKELLRHADAKLQRDERPLPTPE
jgi:hypothetical protein